MLINLKKIQDIFVILNGLAHLEKLTENINHDMNKLREWLIRNKLQHHPTKTKVMYIGSRHNLKIMNDDLPVVINNQLVPRERSFTCLGVKLDETLEWNEHIEVICKKGAAGIGMMKRIKPFVPANTLQTIYQVRVNYRELGFLARNNPRGVTRRKHPEGRRPEGCFLRATLPRDVSR